MAGGEALEFRVNVFALSMHTLIGGVYEYEAILQHTLIYVGLHLHTPSQIAITALEVCLPDLLSI